jgi:hypothetical protein
VNFFFKQTCVALSAGIIIACGGGDDKSARNDDTVSPMQFIKVCESYFTNGSTEIRAGRYNPVPSVQAYGVSKYCECVDGNVNATAAKAMGSVATIAGDDMGQYDENVVNSAMASKIRESGYEYYTDMLAYDRNPEGKIRPGSYKLMGAGDVCSERVSAAQ